MFTFSIRQLALDKVRTLLTAVALGAVISVILVLKGFEQGQYFQLKQIVLNRHADLVAAQSGVTNFIAVRSSIPQLARAEVEAVEGVVEAYPLTAIPIIYNTDNILTPVYVLVYDVKGGPSTIIQGRNIKTGREIVIDQSLALKYHISLGDKFLVTDFEFTVVGFTNEAAFMMPFAFINFDSMVDLFIESEIAPDLNTFPLISYMLIELAPGTDRKEVAKHIEQTVPSVDVIPAEQLANNDVNLGKVFFKPIIGVLVSIGYIIGMLVVGLIMYADIRHRLRSFAILKALGFSASKLFVAVLFQSLLLIAIAIPLGSILAYLLGYFIHSAAPVYLIYVFEPGAYTQTIIASFVIALLGAIIPLRLIQRSDPMLAFQGT